MSRVFLHIGNAKTGTTSFQARLSGPGALAGTGFWSPRTGRARKGAHHLLVRGLLGINPESLPSDNAQESLRREIAAHDGDAVISSEFCARILRKHRPLFGQLLRVLSGLFDEIIIICVWRHTMRSLNSRYQQVVCSLANNDDFQTYALNDARLDDQQARYLLRQMRAGQKVVNIAYRDDGNFDSTEAIAKAIGFTWCTTDTQKRLNESRSLAQLSASRQLIQTRLTNHLRLPRHQCHLIRSLIKETVVDAGGDHVRFQGLTPEILSRIEAISTQSCNRLAHAAWDTSWDDALGACPLTPHQSCDLHDLPRNSRYVSQRAVASVMERLPEILATPSPNVRNERSFAGEIALLTTLTKAARAAR